MIPIGWTKMECPVTKEVQERKVAKIVPEESMVSWSKETTRKIPVPKNK